MLKSVTLQNYKCFSNKTQIELAPLTILTGVNNSGKTTILDSLALKPEIPNSAEITNCFIVFPYQREAFELSKLFNIPLKQIDYIIVEMHYTSSLNYVKILVDDKSYTVSLTGRFKDDTSFEEANTLCTTSQIIGSLYSKVKHIEADRECLRISNVSDSVKKWLNRMELGNLKSAGARYVFPILTAGTQLQPEQTLIVENPEVFLHPKNQMELADFFLSLVNQNRQVIIETHSDHIINRVLRRVLECETEALLNATTIYFLEQSSIKEIEMDRVQGISKYLEDFFRQFALETNQIFNAGINNIGKTESSIKEIPINGCLGIREASEDFFGQFADETGHIISAGLDNIKRGNK